MHPNALLIHQFYEAFQRRDAAAMGACYHPNVEFSDPVFPALRGDEARAMWAMLCARGKDLRIAFSEVQANDASGSARWEASYTFGATERRVRNLIQAEFEFRDGRIVRHRDRFSFWGWARQALGLPGLLLGWTPWLHRRVQSQAAKSLALSASN